MHLALDLQLESKFPCWILGCRSWQCKQQWSAAAARLRRTSTIFSKRRAYLSLNGWGLTETAPVLACRRLSEGSEPAANVRGTVGLPIPGTDIRCVDAMRRHLVPSALQFWTHMYTG